MHSAGMKDATPAVLIVDSDLAALTRAESLVGGLGLDCKTFTVAADLLEYVGRCRPCCVIADVHVEGISGLPLHTYLAGLKVPVPTILTCAAGDFPSAVLALKNGAVTILAKPYEVEQLAAAIRDAMALDEATRRAIEQRAALRLRFESLDPREREVMKLMTQEVPNKIIAPKLGISQRTVARIRAAVFEKMQAASVVELVFMARELAQSEREACKPMPRQEPIEAAGRAAQDPSRDERSRPHCREVDERQRQLIVHDLHDGPAQSLAAAIHHLQTHRRLRTTDPQGAEASWVHGMDLLDHCMTELRRLMQGLQPALLTECGLVNAVSHLAQMYRRDHGLQIEFHHDVQFHRLAPALENTLFRIVQEALGNLWRHSRSKRCRIMMVQRGESICVEIRDWGIGGATLRVDQGHFGLAGIQNRARLFGGRATIQSEQGHGTRIAVEVPLADSEAI